MALLPAAALADNIEIELSALTAGAYGPGWTYNITNNSLLLGAHNYTFTGGTFTCSIDIKDGTISSGTFSGEVDNYGTIVSGTFSNTVINQVSGTISGGTFSGEVRSNGAISGGTFNGTVNDRNGGRISSGTFNGTVHNLDNGTRTSTISGGTFGGAVYNNDHGTISGGNFRREITGIGDKSGYNYGIHISGSAATSPAMDADNWLYAPVNTAYSFSFSGTRPLSLRILRGSELLTAGTDYTYDPATGAVTIHASAMTAPLAITPIMPAAAAVPRTGDADSPALYAGLMLLTLSGLIALRKRRARG